MFARVQTKFSVNPVTQQRQNALTLTLEKRTLFIPLTLFWTHHHHLYCTSFFALHICQGFIKQLEGVSFSWSSRQLFPISPTSWKSLQTSPSSSGIMYSLDAWSWGSLLRRSLAFQILSLKKSIRNMKREHPMPCKGTIRKCLTYKACVKSDMTFTVCQEES